MIKRFDQYNEEFWPLPMTENNIPTAEEFGENMLPSGISWYEEFSTMMVEFAKLHVEAALEAAAKSLESEYPNPSINKNLKVCYPTTNIK